MRQKSEYALLRVFSSFSTLMENYVAQNRAVGNKYNVDVEYLVQFDAYCLQHGIVTAALTRELMDGWCEKRLHESDTSHHTRIRTMRKFAKFLHDNGIEAPMAFHPLPRLPATFTPYIFTRDEVSRFLAAAKRVKQHGGSPLAPTLLPLLFQVLYCCGLRVSEALSLKNEDVDLERGTLLILNAKGQKDRLVPISDSLRERCAAFRANPAAQWYSSEYFFPAPDGGRYASVTIYARFREILWLAGISHGGRGKGPRLHDLRHTFAVHTLDNWAQTGKDIYVCLPILSTYLGHKNLLSTQQYLRLTREAYPALLGAFSEHFGDVFPEVCYDES